jgi:hypothetical protein
MMVDPDVAAKNLLIGECCLTCWQSRSMDINIWDEKGEKIVNEVHWLLCQCRMHFNNGRYLNMMVEEGDKCEHWELHPR